MEMMMPETLRKYLIFVDRVGTRKFALSGTMVQLYIPAISFLLLTLDHDPKYFLDELRSRTISRKERGVTSSLTPIVGN